MTPGEHYIAALLDEARALHASGVSAEDIERGMREVY